MRTNTKHNILQYIESNKPTTINYIKQAFDLSPQIIHRHIKKLIDEDCIYKVGTPPKVYYFPNQKDFLLSEKQIYTQTQEKILEENFVYFWADWVLKYGGDGFFFWCKKRNINPEIEIETYIKTIEKYSKFKDKYWLINWLQKMQTSFPQVYLDEVYYLDFYSIEKYGKTLLGNLMFYAKQTGNKELANKILEKTKTHIFDLIKDKWLEKSHMSCHRMKLQIIWNYQWSIKKCGKIHIFLFCYFLRIKVFSYKLSSQRSRFSK